MRIRWFLLSIAVLSCGVVAKAQSLSNSDFETGPYNVVGTVSGWTVFGNGRVQVLDEGSTSGSYAAAFNVGVNSSDNIMSQSFSTLIGETYTLDFDSGIYGTPTAAQLRVQVFSGAGGTLLDHTVTPSTNPSDPSTVIFSHFHYTFTADNASTILQFTDVGTGNGGSDTLLDTISVAPVPSPTPTPPPPQGNENLLNNGEFEFLPYDAIGSVFGWTAAGNVTATSGEGATSGSHAAAFNVGGSSSNNTLAQNFTTTAGWMYRVDFDAAIFGNPTSSLQLQVQAFGNGTLLNQTVTPPSNPSAVTFQHYQFTFTADTGNVTLQFTDVGTGNSGADTILDTVSVVPQPPTFAQWQMAHFNAAQRNDPSISGWNSDPDRDGLPNGVEYFIHTDPMAATASDQTCLPKVSIQSVGISQYLVLTYRRLVEWPGNPEVIAVSDNLQGWDLSESQLEQVGSATPNGDGCTETVTVRIKTPINQGPILRKFLRLSLTQ